MSIIVSLVYNFPYDIEEDDEDTVEENAELRGLMPFAIVGSEEVVGNWRPKGSSTTISVGCCRSRQSLDTLTSWLSEAPCSIVTWADLKEITHDFLYENYRTEKLSKSVEGGAAAYVYLVWSNFTHANSYSSDSSMNPEDLASQSVRLKEEQLRREEEKLREIEVKVQREINEKRPGTSGS